MAVSSNFPAGPIPVKGQERLAVGQIYLQPAEGLAGPRLWYVRDVELSTPVHAFLFELTVADGGPAPTELDRHWVLIDMGGLALVLDLVIAHNRSGPMDPEKKTYAGQSLERHAFAEGVLERQRVTPPEETPVMFAPDRMKFAEGQPPAEKPHLQAVEGGGETVAVSGQQTIELQMAVTGLNGAGKLLERAEADQAFDAAINYVKAWSVLQSLTTEMAQRLLDTGDTTP